MARPVLIGGGAGPSANQRKKIMQGEIEIQDVGPVKSLSLPYRPGVVVLRGANDCGKSLTLDAVSRLAGGNGQITLRDKAASGYVEGLGVKITVRKSARQTGELEALSLEGDLDISELVDPRLKDPEAADRKRIKALLQLTGTQADVEMFRSLVGDDAAFDAACTPDVLRCDDLVEMAAKLKRNLESASRAAELQAEKAEGAVLAAKSATDGIDDTIETDASILQATLEDAIFKQGRVAATARAASESKQRADLAKQRLAGTTEPDVEAAELAMHKAGDVVGTWGEEVARLERALLTARQNLRESESDHDAKAKAFHAEQAHAESVKGWRETIEAAASVECPTAEEIAESEKAVTDARQAIEKAAVVRAAKEKAAEAAKFREEAKRHRRVADSLRDAARGTDDVLSSAVASQSLTVKGGRLVTQHPERGEVYYAERSTGTRWKIAIDEAIARIRRDNAEKTAVIVIPQVAWSELDPVNQAAIDGYAKENGVCIFTAQADRGELRAEVYGQ